MHKALTIAGSDSGGGAGIQADLKTFCSLHVYGATVITAVTAQNTLGVHSIHPVPAEIVGEQIDAVLSDIGTNACKTGMLVNAETVHIVAEHLKKFNVKKLVVDPVMIAKGGANLLNDNAIDALKSELFPLALVVTPNVPEAEILTGVKISCPDDMIQAAAQLLKTGAKVIVIKGGHLEGDATDLIYTKEEQHYLRSARIMTRCVHGTGCTFSAAITAYLTRGMETIDAIKCSKTYITQAIITAKEIGGGHAPTNHFWNAPK
ncbi:MAG: bifunctional hydroxymethylpyrimidine kinase/phosphomethylpyrimidine kinase [Chlamydiae bacterium]|nr:MAG: bifunctional hydroxymethylpyrimidine kinase/phosphomethylpyrimidine kinase [Chlamydiota bacterium]